VVVDGSKFGRAHIGVVRGLDDIDVIVTAEAPSELVAHVRAAGVQVVVADDTAPGRNHSA